MSAWLCLWWMSVAHGVAPGPEIGSEPVRYRSFTTQGQAAFERTEAWRSFQATQRSPWRVQADERAQRAFRMWGHQPLVAPDATKADVVDALSAFTAEHASLFRGESFPLKTAGYDPDFDTWYVDFAALRNDVPVWRAALTFRVKHGNLVLVGDETYGDTPLRGDFKRTLSDSMESVRRTGPLAGYGHVDLEAVPMWLPRVERGLLVLRAVHVVLSHTDEPMGDWVSFVDADSGDVLAFYNDIRFLTGSLSATYDDRFPGNGTLTEPVYQAVVVNGNQGVLSAIDGGFTIPDGNSYQAHFLSSVLRVEDTLGNQGLDFTAANPNPTFTSANSSIAAVDTFMGTTKVRQVFNQIVPNESWTTRPIDITVNINDVCNAFYNGTINFFQSGGGCNNTGRLADVIYHEWGHGFHFERMITGSFDGSLSEGAGDVTSFLLTNDPQMAPGFFQSGAFLRNASNNNRFPQDITNEVHNDGLIFAGAMWDTTSSMTSAMGLAYTQDTVRTIFSGLLTGGTNMQGAYSEALVADDDDGNLSNGTPHQCFLSPAFDAHGIGDGSSGGGLTPSQFQATSGPIARASAGQPIAIAASVSGAAGCGGDFAGGASSVRWRADNGSWTTTPLTTTGEDITGSLPAQTAGTVIEYVIEVDHNGNTLTAPTQGEVAPFTTYVGDVLEVRCDDFESGDVGYVHGAVSGNGDDWERGAPAGRSGDPTVAHSGNNVWGNDLGYGDFNGAYESGRHNRLSTPTIGLSHYEGAFLQYWRWLAVEDSVYDQATILVNGNPVWTNAAGSGDTHHTEDQWMAHTVDLGPVSDSIQISWDLVSDAGLEFGGWSIDDVCVLVPATVNNRLGVTDFDASEGLDGEVRLTWTEPVHAPLSEVRVIRKLGGCPTSAGDGEIVYYNDAPSLGAFETVTDAVPTTDTYCYGVFPGDGTASLGFAVEGWNVDSGSAISPATDEEIDDNREENGTDDLPSDLPTGPIDADNPGDDDVFGTLENGCTTGGRGALGAWFMVGLLAVRRRAQHDSSRHQRLPDGA